MEALIGHLPRTHTQLYSDLNTTNNNLSKYNFNLGNTTANNHKNIDRIATFSGGTWVSKDYNADFGGQWCLVDSFLINDNGAMQRIMSTQTNTVLATRYCEKNVWGDWDIGVTKSDLDPLFTSRGTLTISADDAGIGCWRINSVNPVNGISDGILLCFSTFNTDYKVNLHYYCRKWNGTSCCKNSSNRWDSVHKTCY